MKINRICHNVASATAAAAAASPAVVRTATVESRITSMFSRYIVPQQHVKCFAYSNKYRGYRHEQAIKARMTTTTLWHVRNHDAFCVSTHTLFSLSPQSNYVTFQMTFLSSFRRKNDKASPKESNIRSFVCHSFLVQARFDFR